VCGVDSTIALRDGHSADVRCVRHSQLTADEKTEIFNLLETNMRGMYEKTWGWNKDEKWKDIFHPESRLIVVYAVSAEIPSTKSICAFLAFRFTWDDEDEPEYPVSYVYELQIAESFRRLSIGQRLMNLCADISRHWAMEKLVGAV
jgi:N-alpha-acetyltransferase 40